MFVRKALPPLGYSIRQVLALCGGTKAVAQACGISRPLQWTTVPDKHLMTVVKMSHLPISTIRPDFPQAADVQSADVSGVVAA